MQDLYCRLSRWSFPLDSNPDPDEPFIEQMQHVLEPAHAYDDIDEEDMEEDEEEYDEEDDMLDLGDVEDEDDEDGDDEDGDEDKDKDNDTRMQFLLLTYG
jgi:hypothetical protein